MNYLDLFHGIGGFALGAYWAGMKFENHYCSDIEPYCQELYAKRFPDSIQLGDITKIKTEDLPDGEWIITGGFPCQDISIAGRGAGITGARSGLWFEYWRIINDLRPRYAIMENVGMLIHRGLREVLGSLAEIGYNAEWQDIRASDMGAPHKRERIWIVAYPWDCPDRTDRGQAGKEDGIQGEHRKAGLPGELGRTGDDKEILSDTERLDGSSRRDRGESLNKKSRDREAIISGSSGKSADVPHSRCEHGEGNEIIREHEIENRQGDALEPERPIKCNGKGITTDTASKGLEREKSEGLRFGEQGLLAERGGWATESGLGCGPDGIPAGLGRPLNVWSEDWEEGIPRLAVDVPKRIDKLKCLGNSIVPQIAQLLFMRIKEILED